MNTPQEEQQQVAEELTRKGDSDDQVLRQLLDALPIYATRIGYRSNSTEDQQAFGKFLFEVGRQWDEWKAGR